MKLPKVLIGAGGLSVAALVFWSALAPADDSGVAHESRITLALASTPFILRDGRQAAADVVQVHFEPQSASLSEDAESSFQELLGRLAGDCLLSAQVVGAASEYETAPRPVVDAHLLALERADAIAELVRGSGVPAMAVASLWTVDSGRQVPDSVLWLFSSSSRSSCAEPTPSLERTAVSVASVTSPGPVHATIINPPMRRPERVRPAPEAPVIAEALPPASAPVAELALTFADNSSYLDDSELERLRAFASNLSADCRVVLRATVAGGADAQYAIWLAERRIARVAQQLGNLVTVKSHELERNNSRRQVMVLTSEEQACTT